MKYARSLLVTTVLAVFGLGVAAQNLHSHDRDAPARPDTTAASLVKPVAWTDPPARHTPETTGALAVALPAAQPAVATSPETAPVEAPRRSTATHRGKGVERNRSRVAHLRRPARARTAAVDPAAMPRPTQQPAPEASGRIDPIGDILRGLGLGRDS